MGKISRSLTYVIYINGTDPLYWGGGLILKNKNNLRIFNLQRSDRILTAVSRPK